MEWCKKVGRVIAAIISDLVHLLIIVALFAYTFYTVFADGNLDFQQFWSSLRDCLLKASVSELFTFIGAVAFILFGIVGVYEYAYSNGLHAILPHYYKKLRKRRDEQIAETMMKTYYEQDIDFIQQYEQERAGHLLQALGINETQFQHIRYELVRARVMPANTEEQLAEKLQKIIFNINSKDFIVDQTKVAPCNRVYSDVNYFINLYTALYDPQLCTSVGRIMASYIMLRWKANHRDLSDIDYIVIPYGGNLLLGLEVGKLLQKPVIAVQEHARILKEELWDGNYICRPGHTNHIIVLNDVLVSGKRIYESVQRLRPDTYIVEGVYFLIQYDHKTFRPKDELKAHGLENVNCLMHTNERILKKVCEKSKRERQNDQK